ncbi:MAG: patatin-like phospholipase family protein [Hyphomicrobiaceae bacterium]
MSDASSVTRSAPLAVAGRRSIALALGGGGARGLAHILVLEAFDELGLRPSCIAGTSIGALFGAAYASGLSVPHIRALAEETLASRFDVVRQLIAARSDPVGKLLRLVPLRTALLDSEAVLEMVFPKGVKPRFEDLDIPLQVVATDLLSQSQIVMGSGDLHSAVAASIAIPILFQPVRREGRLLLDGGLSNPLPYDLVAGRADLTVAIDVGGAAREARIGASPSIIEISVHSIQIIQKSITRERMKYVQPDVYLDVELDEYGALDFLKIKEILAAAEPMKAQLKRQLERLVAAETVALPALR